MADVIIGGAILSDPKFNVRIKDFVLESNPARMTIHIDVAGQSFFSKITYHTIPSWDELWSKAGSKTDKSLFLGTVVAWDCMRFMALGGEILELCDGLSIDDSVQHLWRTCFLKQFGEWRCRNGFKYSSPDFPKLTGSTSIAHDMAAIDASAHIECGQHS